MLLGTLGILVAAISGPSAYEDWARQEREREAITGLNELFFAMRMNFGSY